MVLQRVISVARRRANVNVHQGTTRLVKAVSWLGLVSMVIFLVSHRISHHHKSLHIPRHVDSIALVIVVLPSEPTIFRAQLQTRTSKRIYTRH